MTRQTSSPNSIMPVTASKKQVWCLYGNSGIGKTRLIGETEERTLLIRPPLDHTDSIRKGNTKEWVVPDWGAMDDVTAHLRGNGSDDWDWVWLDSGSLFQPTGLDDLWDTVITEKPNRARYGPDKQEYGINMFRLMTWIRHMIGTPGFNFGVTAHVAEVEGLVAPGETLLGPLLQGKNMPQQLVAMCNVVGYYALDDKGRRVLHTKLHDDYFAKDQFDAFGESGDVRNPTWAKLMTAIEEARAARKTSRTKTTRGRRTTSRRRTATRRSR